MWTYSKKEVVVFGVERQSECAVDDVAWIEIVGKEDRKGLPFTWVPKSILHTSSY